MTQTDYPKYNHMLVLLELDKEEPYYDVPILNMDNEMLEKTIVINRAAQGLLKCIYKHPDYYNDLLKNLAYGMMLRFEMDRREESKS